MGTNVAVIGTGYWGKNLVRNFHELGALRLICDTNPAAAESMLKQYGGTEATASYSEVLSNPDVDGVVISTPAETHYPLAKDAILAGKHVFVEKPFVLHVDEGQHLIALAREHGRILMVGHLLHYHPVFVRLKSMVQAGELGRINYIYSNRLNLGKIRREENILFSFAPHDISMILSLAGGVPHKITATGGNYLHHEIADVTTTHLEFPSGLKAHIFVSWLHPFKEQKLVVVGDRKMAVFDDTLPWENKLLLYPHDIKWKNGTPVPDKADPERVDVESSEPLKAECAYFLDCIARNRIPYTNGEEGLNVLRVLNAAQKSMDNHSCEITFADTMKVAREWFAHETAVVGSKAKIGKGSKIWHFSHIMDDAELGENVNVGQNVVVGPDARIGNGCKIQNNVSVYKGVTLEENVFCGPSMVFTNVFNPRAHIKRMSEARETLVQKGATLGANSTIVCGVTIGRYAMVGAGAVVTRDVPAHALMKGNPARQDGWVCSCGVGLNDDLVCEACGLAYELVDDALAESKKK